MSRLFARSLLFLLAAVLTGRVPAAAQTSCPAGTVDQIWADPAICTPTSAGTDCEQNIPWMGGTAKTILSWCVEDSSSILITVGDDNTFLCTDPVAGQVGSKAVLAGIPIPPDEQGTVFNLWRVNGCTAPDPNRVFLDRTRVHQIKAPANIGSLFSILANPTIRCTVDPSGLQFCRDPQSPGMTPKLKWALAGVDPDAYDLMLWVRTEADGHVVRNYDDPNLLFEDITDPDGPDRAESFNGLGASPSDPEFNPDEHPWTFEFWLVDEDTSSVGWQPSPASGDLLGSAIIRAAAGGSLTVNNRTCQAGLPCTVTINEAMARNFFDTLIEIAEIRGPEDQVLWSSENPLIEEGVPSSTEVWANIPPLDLGVRAAGTFEIRFVGRSTDECTANQSNCDTLCGQTTPCPDAPPYVYERELDRISISVLAANAPASVARLSATQNPCEAVTSSGCTSLKCDADLLVEGDIQPGDTVGVYRVEPTANPNRYAVGCITGATALPAPVVLGCNNTPGPGEFRNFELRLVDSCVDIPSTATNTGILLDSMTLQAHPPFDPAGGESLVCSTNNKSLTSADSGALGVTIHELSLPALASDGTCNPNDINYQRAKAVAENLPAGIRYIRRAIRWPEVQPSCNISQPSCPAPDFRRYQCLLEPFADEGYEFIFTLTRSPDWACKIQPPTNNELGTCVPDVTHWGNFITAALAAIPAHAYDIWQEPEFDKFFAGTTSDYKELLEEAYQRAAAFTPRPEIWGGNVLFGQYKNAYLVEQFMEQILDPDNVVMDGLAIHDFREAGDSDGRTANTVRYAREFLNSLTDANGGKPYANFPLSVTEFSYAAMPFTLEACIFNDLSPAEQTAYLRDELICGLTEGAENLIWFTATDRSFWFCGPDQATGKDRASGLGVLNKIIREPAPFTANDLVKPHMAIPFEAVGCAIDPMAVRCPAP